MFLVGLISWWYGDGLKGRFLRTVEDWRRTAAFFSIGQLASTLFSPYRQISANVSRDSFAATIKGVFDQLISRIIGSIIRTFTIIAGVVTLIFHLLEGVVLTVLWLFMPLFPIVGAIIFAIGWVPSW